MANYRQRSISGDEWRRCVRIIGDNVFQQIPELAFVEEDIELKVDGRITKIPVGLRIRASMRTPDKVINLISPEDDSPLGKSVTLQDLFVILYSTYRQLADEADAKL